MNEILFAVAIGVVLIGLTQFVVYLRLKKLIQTTGENTQNELAVLKNDTIVIRSLVEERPTRHDIDESLSQKLLPIEDALAYRPTIDQVSALLSDLSNNIEIKISELKKDTETIGKIIEASATKDELSAITEMLIESQDSVLKAVEKIENKLGQQEELAISTQEMITALTTQENRITASSHDLLTHGTETAPSTVLSEFTFSEMLTNLTGFESKRIQKHSENLRSTLGRVLKMAGYDSAVLLNNVIQNTQLLKNGEYVIHFTKEIGNLGKSLYVSGGVLRDSASKQILEIGKPVDTSGQGLALGSQIATSLLAVAHMVSNWDMARSLKRIEIKIDTLTEMLKTERLAKFESIYSESRRILSLPLNENSRSRLSGLSCELKSIRRGYLRDAGTHLSNLNCDRSLFEKAVDYGTILPTDILLVPAWWYGRPRIKSWLDERFTQRVHSDVANCCSNELFYAQAAFLIEAEITRQIEYDHFFWNESKDDIASLKSIQDQIHKKCADAKHLPTMTGQIEEFISYCDRQNITAVIPSGSGELTRS